MEASAERADEGPKKVRAFVALEPPADVRAVVAEWAAGIAAERPLRPVRAGSLHLTLAFLGWLEPDEVERARRVVAALPAAPVGFRIEAEPAAIPPRRPRLVAFDVAGAAIGDLQARVAAELVEAGVYEPERRPFRAHLTVARLRKGADGGAAFAELPTLPAAATRQSGFVRVALYRSELRSQGARYSNLADVELPPPAADEVI
jgi:2'-5' RNA ligase